jgi:hypothetical protein
MVYHTDVYGIIFDKVYLSPSEVKVLKASLSKIYKAQKSLGIKWGIQVEVKTGLSSITLKKCMELWI